TRDTQVVECMILEMIHVRAVTITFFFSSRRRHTSWPRDWSSDVCSSDLVHARRAAVPRPAVALRGGGPDPARHPGPGDDAAPGRSEERRVGKECRSRWSWDD